MRSHRAAAVLTLATVFVALPSAARAADANDDCNGWFCTSDDASAGSPSAAPAGEAQKGAAAGESSENATITLPGGIELPGRVVELVPGDHVTVRLADGSTRTLGWPEVAQIHFSARIVVGGAAPSAPALPAPVVTPAPPPVVVEPAPPPPVTVVDEPRPSFDHERVDSFEPSFTLGAYLSLIAPGDTTSNVIGSGGALEFDGGYRFAKHWRLHAVFELSQYAPANPSTTSDSATGAYVGGGLELNLAPDGPIGWLFDVGMGMRSLSVPTAGSSGGSSMQAYSGFEPLRLAIGLAFPLSKNARLDVRVHTDIGTFSPSDGNGYGCSGTVAYSSCSPSAAASGPTTYSFTGVSVGAHFGL